MTQQIAGLYNLLRNLFRPAKQITKRPTGRRFLQFPENLWELDESYRNLMRELSKR